ncbi:MAG: hypothetical protein TU35_004180 [Thermoproteus sp. AZ2]|uniref:Uncharacterized protein n=1 Tax=Thermoproteus sp. AZ2 TaxID=1609232 RepID=A0ACC6V0B6_9CREN
MCELYWKAVELGVEAALGPLGWAKAFNCAVESKCECDLVVYAPDVVKIGDECVWPIDEPGFTRRRVWLMGLPHISLDDLKKVKCPYAEAVLRCVTDELRRRGASARLQPGG